jgi:NADH:ubiquinone oxidoreductase subunit 5 (subunit L)/multisubunit Na+/H+ antiporter MnhA subunit
MEAPVPISSQLHSSTLVIIGFYVFYRFQDLILISDTVKFIYFFFSFFTIITSTFLGFFQDDGKRLLACSTASQLGYVILCISLGFINESLLLLVFVCCNKAFTFILFGVVMDKNGGVSDIRVYKNLKLNIFEKVGLTFSTLNSTISLGSIN